ncbi:N-acetyltransferase [Candidatus Sumerlaeota bacterium]|nr:N-acetyltransferase [Candidatus Sumerlaeota bacterium]
MKVREAAAEDLPAIVRIYNHAILNTAATFDHEPYTVEQRREWFAQFGGEHPILVFETGSGEVAGFAYYLPYRSKAGYSRTKETTIYVDAAHRKAGVASALYAELIHIAQSRGVHVLIAVLGGNNEPSVALHKKFGFELAGHNREVGHKFGKWVDTYIYQRILGESSGPL